MKTITLTAMVTLALFSACEGQQTNAQSVTLTNDKDSVSYYIGVTFGKNLKQSGVSDFNYELMKRGLQDAASNDSFSVDPQMVQSYVMNYFEKIEQKEADKNQAEALAWLEENKTKEGVKEIEPGLYYKVIKDGSGEKPGAEDTVTVHYTGRLIDGTVFDSSVDRGKPAVFPVNGVIKGWVKGLQMMPKGSKWELYIAPELAYGSSSPQGSKIPPGSTLIFEVELIDIAKK